MDGRRQRGARRPGRSVYAVSCGPMGAKLCLSQLLQPLTLRGRAEERETQRLEPLLQRPLLAETEPMDARDWVEQRRYETSSPPSSERQHCSTKAAGRWRWGTRQSLGTAVQRTPSSEQARAEYVQALAKAVTIWVDRRSPQVSFPD
ncbi:hypothetical protein NDU88_002983 [Pleurodeles waltl]|uniref:Uncharacterized protein n=1 Tax=Pleurodeles waltl TaxID=8319 RepID=A0AAV7M336_PLEWA|nr:hypothetical protein NDU88_002983 [Pleurodeles waltl]